MRIVFWEKPECVGNARQKSILSVAGHQVDARDLIAHPWTREELECFVGGHPVASWFNVSAPRVKSGDVVPANLSTEEAFKLLLGDHILIRRPLIEIGTECLVGFDIAAIERAIGKRMAGGRIHRLRGEDLEKCVGDRAGIRCGTPRP